MPRTRTKYIWPPRDSATPPRAPAPAAADAATTEPHAKKPRLEPIAHLTANERASSSVKDVSHARRDASDRSKENGQDAEDIETLPPMIQALMGQPMDAHIQRYRDWRRLGSTNDEYCMVCQQNRSQSLLSCTTCGKSFHDSCAPPGALYDEQRQWYCRVCVFLKWHLQPPTITPPDSPPSFASASASAVDRSSAEDGNTDTKGNAQGSDQKTTGNQALSILAEISRSMSHGESTHSHALSQSHRPLDVSASYSPSPFVTAASLPGQQGPALLSPRGTESSAQGMSIMDSHARKSRFATLSTEVDSALWVLYRELESVTSLRQRIGELEAEIVKLRQDVSIRDNQIILSRRSLSSSTNLPGGISQAEVDRLRVQAARGEEAMREIELIRAKNNDLEKDLKDARNECAAKDETLSEWKGRLVSLIGN